MELCQYETIVRSHVFIYRWPGGRECEMIDVILAQGQRDDLPLGEHEAERIAGVVCDVMTRRFNGR